MGEWISSSSWTRTSFRDAVALALVVCSATRTRNASGQSLPAGAVRGIEAVDTLVAAEFAKDSIGSMTVGVISGSRLVWTRSVGYADMTTHRLANRNTVYRIGSHHQAFHCGDADAAGRRGKGSFVRPIETILPEVKQIASKPQRRPIHVLAIGGDAAGLAREPDEVGPFWTGPVSTWEKTLLSALPHTRYISAPGTEYSYSNIG